MFVFKFGWQYDAGQVNHIIHQNECRTWHTSDRSDRNFYQLGCIDGEQNRPHPVEHHERGWIEAGTSNSCCTRVYIPRRGRCNGTKAGASVELTSHKWEELHDSLRYNFDTTNGNVPLKLNSFMHTILHLRDVIIKICQIEMI